MNLNEQIQQAELSIEEAEKIKAFGEAISRLEKNADFKKVFFDGYFTDEARRLVFLTADTVLDDKSMAGVYNDIRAIGSVRTFLMHRKQLGELAAYELEQHKETLDELRNQDQE